MKDKHMPAITVKRIPQELYERLKESARIHRRSINSEILVCLERVLLTRKVDPKNFISRIEGLQTSLSLPPLTDDFLSEVKNAGRP